MSAVAGSVDLTLNLKGQPQAVQGVTQMGAAVKESSKAMSAALESASRYFDKLGKDITQASATTTALNASMAKTAPAIHSTTDAFEQASNAAKNMVKSENDLTSTMKTVEAGSGGLEGAFRKLIGVATGFVVFQQIGRSLSEFVKTNTQVENLTLQFQSLLGSTGAARSRMKDLYDFAAKTPFNLGEVARADKLLEVLTRGALSSKESLRMVGDAAAISGSDFEGAAMWIGRLYNQLQNNRPLDEAGMRLTELGLLTGDTRTKLEHLVATGKASTEGWNLFVKELDRTKGGMELLSHSTEGLTSTLQDNVKQFLLYIGEGGAMGALKTQLEKLNTKFSDADEKLKSLGHTLGRALGEGMESAAAAMKSLLPIAQFVAENLQSLIHIGEALFAMYAVSKFVAIANAIRGIATALQFAAASNPILAALAVSVGVAVLAYQSYEKHQKGIDQMAFWSSEEGRIKSANQELNKSVELTKTVSDLHARMIKAAGQTPETATPFPTVNYTPGKGPATVTPQKTPLSDSDQKELEKLNHDATKAMLEATKDGFDLQFALEDQHHKEEVARFIGKNELIQAEARRHTQEMAKITKEQVEAQTKEQDSIDHKVDQANKNFETREMANANRNLKIKQDEKAKREKLDDEYTKRTLALDREVTQSKLAFASDAAGAFAKFTGAAKLAFFANKAIAATSIVLNSLMAQGAAVAPPPIGLGPIAGLGLIPKLETLMAFELAGVAAQTLQGFASGGFIQGQYSTGDRNIIRANAGEVVLTPAQQREFMALAKGEGAGGGGNQVSITYAPVYPNSTGAGGQSFTEQARADRVEFGRFINQELRPKGYVK